MFGHNGGIGEAPAMHMGRIEAAEEIQLLLPENQPEADQDGNVLLIGAALLLLALPCWALGTVLRRPPAAPHAPARG
jgi:hypothetical protein